MYLINLKIKEGVNEQKTIRDVPFNPTGLNIVVDETKDGKGNNVGKTTFLRVIDLCLGASDKKYLWTDYDSGSENGILKQYIDSNKVFAELVISDNTNKYTLRRDLFTRGTQYINGEKININKYRDKLNDIFFSHISPPSFRQLIGKFVRIKQTDDSFGTLRYLHNNTSHDQYTNIYEFLYKLSDPEISTKKYEYSQMIKENEDLRNNLLKAHSIENLDDLYERTRLISNEVSLLEKNINKYISLSQYKDDINKLSQIKEKINKKSDMLSNLKFKKTKVLDILRTEKHSEDNIDNSLLSEFYNEVKQNIDSIKVKFDQLIKFNNQIKTNRIKYYTKELSRLDDDISNLIKSRNILIENNSDILKLLEDDNFEKFKTLHEKLLKNKESLGELNEIKSAYENVNLEIENAQKELKQLDYSSNNKDNLEKFNDYFSQLSEKVIGQRLYLIPNEGFPLKLSNIDEGAGTGYRKTITLLLDISYVYFIKQLEINYPVFFVHDVLESVDEHNMRSIVHAINSVDAQFIFAILREKIDNYDFIQDKDIVLSLSEDDKLFKI